MARKLKEISEDMDKNKSIHALKSKLLEYKIKDKQKIIEHIAEKCAISFDEKYIDKNVSIFVVTIKGLRYGN